MQTFLRFLLINSFWFISSMKLFFVFFIFFNLNSSFMFSLIIFILKIIKYSFGAISGTYSCYLPIHFIILIDFFLNIFFSLLLLHFSEITEKTNFWSKVYDLLGYINSLYLLNLMQYIFFIITFLESIRNRNFSVYWNILLLIYIYFIVLFMFARRK